MGPLSYGFITWKTAAHPFTPHPRVEGALAGKPLLDLTQPQTKAVGTPSLSNDNPSTSVPYGIDATSTFLHGLPPLTFKALTPQGITDADVDLAEQSPQVNLAELADPLDGWRKQLHTPSPSFNPATSAERAQDTFEFGMRYPAGTPATIDRRDAAERALPDSLKGLRPTYRWLSGHTGNMALEQDKLKQKVVQEGTQLKNNLYGK